MGTNKIGKHSNQEIQAKVDALIKAQKHLDKHIVETQRKLDRVEIALLKSDTNVHIYTHQERSK